MQLTGSYFSQLLGVGSNVSSVTIPRNFHSKDCEQLTLVIRAFDTAVRQSREEHLLTYCLVVSSGCTANLNPVAI
jgi:hypothetical protein